MTHPGERPHMPVPINRQSMPGRIPVPSIGRRDPADHQPGAIMVEIATLVYGDATTQSLLNNETLKSMPTWALALMNQNRLMSIELGAFYAIMVKRGLLTPAEIKSFRRSIQQQHDETTAGSTRRHAA